MPGKRLVAQIKTQLDPEQNLAQFYDANARRISIPNIAIRFFEGYSSMSDTITRVVVPLSKFTLNKCALSEDGTTLIEPDQLLPGAVFSIKDKTNLNIEIREITDTSENPGKYVFDEMIPGHTYEIKEISAPYGHRINSQASKWWLVRAAQLVVSPEQSKGTVHIILAISDIRTRRLNIIFF